MTEKNIKSRIVHKHDTEENWLKAVNFIPKHGELIIYDKDANYDYVRLKIGDGVTNVNSLFFTDTYLIEQIGDIEATAENAYQGVLSIEDSLGGISLSNHVEYAENTYAKKSDISSVYKYKGNAGPNDLNSLVSGLANENTGLEIGDVYNIVFQSLEEYINLEYYLQNNNYWITSNPSLMIRAISDYVEVNDLSLIENNLIDREAILHTARGLTFTVKEIDKENSKIITNEIYSYEELEEKGLIYQTISGVKVYNDRIIYIEYKNPFIEGDNVAWTGYRWDKLSATIDISPFITKEEVETNYAKKSDITSVYRYKGNVSNNNSDENKNTVQKTMSNSSLSQIGDVYNITEPIKISSVRGTSLSITYLKNTETNENYIYVPDENLIKNYLIPDTNLYVWATELEYTVTKVDISANAVYITPAIEDTLVNTTDNFVGLYYKYNTGDNIAWNGFIWDKLGGSIDTSQFTTKTELESMYAKKSDISSVYKYKGNVSSNADGEDPNNEIISSTLNNHSLSEIGDVYNVTEDMMLQYSPSNISMTYLKSYNTNKNYIEISDEEFVKNYLPVGTIIRTKGTDDAAPVEYTITSIHPYYKEIYVTPDIDDSILNTSKDIFGIYYNYNTGDNIAWNGYIWDKLGGTIDTSKFATKTDINSLLSFDENGNLVVTINGVIKKFAPILE